MRTLPTEVLCLIVRAAWSSTANPDERSQFHMTLSTTHPHFFQVAADVTVRNPMFKFEPSHKDLKLYASAVERIEGLSQKDNTDSNIVLSMPRASHITFDVTMMHSCHAESKEIWTSRLDNYLNAVQMHVGSYSSVTITSLVTLPLCALEIILDVLHRGPTLTHLYLNVSSNISKLFLGSWDHTFSAIRFLRLKAVPACNCGSRPRMEPDGHWQGCLLASIPHIFSKAEHLHLDTATLLKDLDPPHSIRALTLESQPAPLLPGKRKSRTLVGYNIPSAFARGFMCWPGPGGKPVKRTVFIRSILCNTYGAKDAQDVCTKYGIELREDV